MLDQASKLFETDTDYDMNLMKQGLNIYGLIAEIISGLLSILEEFQPEYVYVNGGYYYRFDYQYRDFLFRNKGLSIEAGFRTINKKAPFAEEINRTITSHVAENHFVPTLTSFENLIREDIYASDILILKTKYIYANSKS